MGPFGTLYGVARSASIKKFSSAIYDYSQMVVSQTAEVFLCGLPLLRTHGHIIPSIHREQTRWLDTTCKSNAFHKLVSRVQTSKHCLQDEDFNTIKAPLLVALIRKQPLLTQRLSHQLRGLEYTTSGQLKIVNPRGGVKTITKTLN